MVGRSCRVRRPVPIAFIMRRLRKVEELGSVRRPVAEDHRVREETLLRPPRGRPAGVLVHVVAGLQGARRIVATHQETAQLILLALGVPHKLFSFSSQALGVLQAQGVPHKSYTFSLQSTLGVL